jgi:hypothetical protein
MLGGVKKRLDEGNTFAFFPSITATQEFVVPRSMPITAPFTA